MQGAQEARQAAAAQGAGVTWNHKPQGEEHSCGAQRPQGVGRGREEGGGGHTLGGSAFKVAILISYEVFDVLGFRGLGIFF